MKESCEENLLALGMLADLPLETFLKENPQIKEIIFALDHDEKRTRSNRKLIKSISKEDLKCVNINIQNNIRI